LALCRQHFTHRLLHPNGLLINVHDLPTPHVIEVHSPETVHKVGWLLDKEDFDSTRSALNALAQVVADRYFILEDERDFGYNIYVDDLNELREWLAEWWASAILADRIIQRLEELIRDLGQSARICAGQQHRAQMIMSIPYCKGAKNAKKLYKSLRTWRLCGERNCASSH
jgi:hypothetical protein